MVGLGYFFQGRVFQDSGTNAKVTSQLKPKLEFISRHAARSSVKGRRRSREFDYCSALGWSPARYPLPPLRPGPSPDIISATCSTWRRFAKESMEYGGIGRATASRHNVVIPQAVRLSGPGGDEYHWRRPRDNLAIGGGVRVARDGVRITRERGAPPRTARPVRRRFGLGDSSPHRTTPAIPESRRRETSAPDSVVRSDAAGVGVVFVQYAIWRVRLANGEVRNGCESVVASEEVRNGTGPAVFCCVSVDTQSGAGHEVQGVRWGKELWLVAETIMGAVTVSEPELNRPEQNNGGHRGRSVARIIGKGLELSHADSYVLLSRYSEEEAPQDGGRGKSRTESGVTFKLEVGGKFGFRIYGFVAPMALWVARVYRARAGGMRDEIEHLKNSKQLVRSSARRLSAKPNQELPVPVPGVEAEEDSGKSPELQPTLG
ncbi:hypothetical protein K438DRAFT_1944093 [Mycena galopus ATCC 62051]|nr:hypothetical protein K438DRAFT_1944093 [Mycena galopus ATCC 62051]